MELRSVSRESSTTRLPTGCVKTPSCIDFDEVRALAREHKPKLIVAGASAYPRIMEYEPFREIASEIGAALLVDFAHIAGLVAVGLHPSPIPLADFVSSTTHKTLRGPRGGFVLCTQTWAAPLDKSVFPGIQGGPLMHTIAAKAVAFGEALRPDFKTYQEGSWKMLALWPRSLCVPGCVWSGRNRHASNAR